MVADEYHKWYIFVNEYVGRSEFGVRRREKGYMENYDFEKLRSYQKALDFTNAVYKITINFPPEERFGLADQFRRAVVFIPLNIAEGSGGSTAEFKQFIKIARRSI